MIYIVLYIQCSKKEKGIGTSHIVNTMRQSIFGCVHDRFN